jgi:hypothetical protein
MNLTTRLFVAALACLALPDTVFAQPAASEPRLGVGISLADVGELVAISSEDSIASTVIPGVLIPIKLTNRVRIEPEIGGYRNSSTVTQNLASGSLPTSHTYTFFRVGTGAFWLATKDRVTIYYGGRLSYLRYTQSSTVAGRESFTYPTIPGKSFAPVVGGEFHLSDHFRLGGEVQVRFISWDTGPTPVGTSVLSSTITGNSVSTHGALTLRFFF